jgi:hypothetical protein
MNAPGLTKGLLVSMEHDGHDWLSSEVLGSSLRQNGVHSVNVTSRLGQHRAL